MSTMAVPERLLTARFTLVVGAGLAYFLSLGMVLPVVPQYVEDRLGGGSVAVGVAVGMLFVGAVLFRPWVGRLGDRTGRRLLMIVGAAVVAVSVVLYGAVESLPFLGAVRALTGVGEAAFFVGAATMITDLAPVERRGEAISYWSVAVYGGLAFGPALGETVLEASSFGTVWLVAGGLALVATALSVFTRDIERPAAPANQGPLINRAAIAPGTVLFCGLIALAAFTAFVPLYVDDVGLDGAEGVFILYGGLVLVVRIFGARLPDILGGRRSGAIALTGTAVGMGVMAAWGTAAGLFTGTVAFALGASMLYPALLLLALERGGEEERASVVGTVSTFFDLSQGLGSLLVGAVAAVTSYQGAFAAGAVFAVIGFVLLRYGSAAHVSRTATVADEGAFAAEHPGP
jgi:MFS family permease